MSSRTPHALPKGLLQKGPKGHGRLHGAALIIVLAFLIILTGIAVAFLSSVSTESASSSASASAVTTRGLADAAVQLTISQIRDATAGFARNADGSLNTASPVCWASQPGAIRTYDTTAAAVATYKLYSSTTMVDTVGNNPTNDIPAAGWYTNTGYYTDLNAPVQVSNSSGATIITNYPILDPAMTNTSGGSPLVDGFQINTGTPMLSGYTASNAAAMPVRWIYMLKDGTLTTPASVSGKVYTFTNNIPTASNPIVGRIAFWTYDETCKLNINTASEGSFWATPSFSTSADQAFSLYPPAGGEYNRYPGHPATTSLSPALWSYMGLSSPYLFLSPLPNNNGIYDLSTNNNTPAYAGGTSVTNYLTNLFTNVTPRYSWGGSYGGISSLIANPSVATALLSQTNRLYANVDEFFFSPTNPILSSRTVNQGGFGPGDVARLKFFLTAESRAPEVNPLNLPKICMWPVPDKTRAMTVNPASVAGSTRTIKDQLIAFCSTLGGYPYYFTRYDASTSGNDFANTPRNKIVYNYLRRLMNQSVPGFKGGAFAATGKWTSIQTDQIGTLLFDYIRSCINLNDSSTATYPLTTYTWPYSYTVPPTATNTKVVPSPGTGQVVPIVITNPDDGVVTRGMGRFPTLRAGTLWFIARAANQPPLMCHPDGRPIVYDVYGNQISSNAAGVSIIITNAPYTIGGNTYTNNGITNTIPVVTYTNGPLIDVVLRGVAFARINPMHPWTCPYTNYISNTSYTGNIMIGVPQVVAGNNPYATTNIPVLADAKGAAYMPPNVTAPYPAAPIPTSWRNTNDPSSMTNLYPIFALSTNNQIPSMANSGVTATRAYPSYGSTAANSPMLSYSWNPSTIPWYVTNNSGGGGKGGGVTWTNMVNPNTGAQYAHRVATLPNASSASVTHPGLIYLTVQNPTSGAFTMTNSNSAAGLPLLPHDTLVEMAYLQNFVTVTPGSCGINPKLSASVTGFSSFAIGGTVPTFSSGTPSLNLTNGAANAESTFLYDQELLGLLMGVNSVNTNSLHTVNNIILNSSGGSTFPFTGGNVVNSISSLTGSSPQLVQTITQNFPNATFPIPKLPHHLYLGFTSPYWVYPPTNSFGPLITTIYNGTTTNYNNMETNPANYSFTNRISVYAGNENQPYVFPTDMGIGNAPTNYGDVASPWRALNWITADTIQSVDLIYSDPRMISCFPTIPASFYAPNPLYGYFSPLTINGWTTWLRNAHSIRSGAQHLNGGNYGTLMFVNGTNSFFLPPLSDGTSVANGGFSSASLVGNPGLPGPTATNLFGYAAAGTRGTPFYISSNTGHGSRPQAGPDCDFNNAGFQTLWKAGGDFDNGVGYFPDGPYMNKSDEGFGSTNSFGNQGIVPYYSMGYAPGNLTSGSGSSVKGGALFSPNLQVPSPLLFGSIPTGFSQLTDPANPSTNILQNSWLTLQFCPNANAQDVAGGDARRSKAGISEAGSSITTTTTTVIPDHLLLDFFQMPVVDPYPISDSFSTAGKVNMNYQIVPFSHITRSTALRGVLKPVMITAVDDQWGYDYKLRNYWNYSDNTSHLYSDTSVRVAGVSYDQFGANSGQLYFHYPIHVGETLKQFDARFTSTAGGDLFRSPSEICALWLYPATQPTQLSPLNVTNPLVNWDAANANIKQWWYANAGTTRKSLTGDNIRERPYSYIYPRLTTKSNTYQIHYRVQTLKQTPTAHGSGNYSTWIDPGAGTGTADKVLGEVRGSAIIERYIDPSDTTIPDFAGQVSTSGLGVLSQPANIMDTYYKFRVISMKQFNP